MATAAPSAGHGFTRRRVLGGIALGGAVAATGGFLAGCGGDSNSPTGNTPDASELAKLVPTYKPVEYVKPDLPRGNGVDPGHLNYPSNLVRSADRKPGAGSNLIAMVSLAGPAPKPAGSNAYQDLVNERLGAKITFTYVPQSEYAAKLATVLAGDVPDILQMLAWNLPKGISAAASERFTDLTEYLSGDAALAYPNLANLPTVHWESAVFAGRLYAIPQPGPLLSSGLFYRADIFESAGLAVPKSAAEFEAACQELTDTKAGRWAMGTPYQRPAMWMFRSPSTWRLNGGSLVRSYETDEFAAAVEWARKMHASGHVHPDISTRQTPRKKELFNSGQAVMVTDGMGAWLPTWAQQTAINPQFKIMAMPPFAADGGKPVHYAPDTDDPNAYYTFIKKGLPKSRVEEILRILNFCAAPIGTEEYHLLHYGQEGVQHNLASNGTPKLTDVGKAEIGRAYFGLAHPPQETMNFDYPESVRAMHAWQTEAAKHMVSSPTRGITLDIPARLASIDQKVEDTVVDVVLGRADMSRLRSAVDEWRATGGDELRRHYEDALARR